MNEALNPKQLAKEGKAAFQRDDYVAAAKAFQAAAQGYGSTGDELNAAEMRNNSSVAFLKAGDAQASLQAVEGTAAIFAAAGDIRRQGLALGNLGAALEAVDRKQEAAEAYEQSADLLKQAGEEQMRAHVLQSLSNLQLRSGRQIEALATMEAGIESFEHPTLKQRLLKKLLRFPFRLMGR
jgi:tetratricopeptide (TPR) repeat protein